jgi:hypothetical protein
MIPVAGGEAITGPHVSAFTEQGSAHLHDVYSAAEAVMGPFVQLDSVVVNSDPPVDLRDPAWSNIGRFSPVPRGGAAAPAGLLFSYHRRAMLVTERFARGTL